MVRTGCRAGVCVRGGGGVDKRGVAFARERRVAVEGRVGVRVTLLCDSTVGGVRMTFLRDDRGGVFHGFRCKDGVDDGNEPLDS